MTNRTYFPTQAAAEAELAALGYVRNPDATSTSAAWPWIADRGGLTDAEVRYNDKGFWIEERA